MLVVINSGAFVDCWWWYPRYWLCEGVVKKKKKNGVVWWWHVVWKENTRLWLLTHYHGSPPAVWRHSHPRWEEAHVHCCRWKCRVSPFSISSLFFFLFLFILILRRLSNERETCSRSTFNLHYAVLFIYLGDSEITVLLSRYRRCSVSRAYTGSAHVAYIALG